MARARRIWTIGYEGHSPESLVLFLRRARIERLVDVRELPLSRRTGFSKTALSLGLQRAGIAYSHVRALGTPRALRHEYKASGDYARFRGGYLAHLRANEAALAELEDVASRERCALLCVEREAETCHRGILADVLAERGWRAEHL